MSENEVKLLPCPVCGAKAFIFNDVVDGFWFGWSVGCPRYRIGDGIHGIETFEESEKKALVLHGFYTKKEAIEAWNRRVSNDNGKIN